MGRVPRDMGDSLPVTPAQSCPMPILTLTEWSAPVSVTMQVSSLDFTMSCLGFAAIDFRVPVRRCVLCGASSDKGFNIVLEVGKALGHGAERG